MRCLPALALVAAALPVPTLAIDHIISDPVIEADRVLVEMRPIFEAFGAQVVWNAASKEIVATRDGTTIRMRINQQTAYVDGRATKLSVPPRLVGGATRVPLRFVSTALGASVDFKGSYVALGTPGGGQVVVHLVKDLLDAVGGETRRLGLGGPDERHRTVGLGPWEYLVPVAAGARLSVRQQEGLGKGMSGDWAFPAVNALDAQGHYLYQGAGWLMRKGRSGWRVVAFDEGTGIPRGELAAVPRQVIEQLGIQVLDY